MRERAGLILKIACGVLAALALYQFGRAVIRVNPLGGIAVPALPTLADAETGKGTNSPAASAKKGTNSPPNAASTNSASATNAAGTNAVKAVRGKDTNSVPHEALAAATNAVRVRAEAEAPAANSALVVAAGETNLPANVLAMMRTNVPLAGTNGVMITGTNPAVRKSAADKGTNAPSPRDVAMAGANPRAAAGRKPADIPPDIKARIDRIVESEIMGQITRPPPMALLGIAGNSAMLRTPSGQTGLVKEGDELGGIKLLQIGINRVLIEEQGQKKELTIFSGFGSESLLSRQKDTPDETTKK